MVVWLLAAVVALLHGLLAVFVIAGAPLAAHSSRLMQWYLVLLAPIAAVNLPGLPCPLTVWEKDLWRLAGHTPYRGGFISQYFVRPFYAPGLRPDAETVLLVAATVWCLGWLLYAVVLRSRLRAEWGTHRRASI